MFNKRCKDLPFTATWVDPEMIVLRERQIPSDIIYMCNVRQMIETTLLFTKRKYVGGM